MDSGRRCARSRTSGNLDLEVDERLCAIALVKRFFPRVSKEVIGRGLDMQSWPSTVSIAAVPWMRLIKDKPEVHAASKAYAGTRRQQTWRQSQ